MDPFEKNTVPKVFFVLSYAFQTNSIWQHKKRYNSALFSKWPPTATVVYKYYAFKRAPNSNCNVKYLAFKEAANSHFNM